MGSCVGKKEKIIIVNKPKNEQIKKNRVNSKLYEKNSISSSSLSNESKISFLSIDSTEFSEIHKAYDNENDENMNNGNTFKEILDLINIKKD